MKRLITLILLCMLSVCVATAQSDTPKIKGALGFKLGMSKQEAKHVITEYGWNNTSIHLREIKETPTNIEIDFSEPQYIAGFELESIHLMFYDNQLAKVMLLYPTEIYDSQKPISAYSSYRILERLIDKYGSLALSAKRGDGSNLFHEKRGPVYLKPTIGDEFQGKTCLQFSWVKHNRQLFVNYRKYKTTVMQSIHYIDVPLFNAYLRKLNDDI